MKTKTKTKKSIADENGDGLKSNPIPITQLFRGMSKIDNNPDAG